MQGATLEVRLLCMALMMWINMAPANQGIKRPRVIYRTEPGIGFLGVYIIVMSTTVTCFLVRIDEGVSGRGYYSLNAFFF